MSQKTEDQMCRSIRRKMFSSIKNLDVQELEFIMREPYIQQTEILHFMEVMVQSKTKRFRERCQLWRHKLDMTNCPYPTLYKLTKYRSIYENWDGNEPFPSREVEKIAFYLD